jgi:hypothetical protein
MPYIFSFDKLKRPHNKKYKLSKEEKKRIKEWEFLQELRMKKIKDDEMQHFLCNVGDGKFINESKQALESANALNNKQKNAKLIPKLLPVGNGNFENPALILDDERNIGYNMKTTSVNSTEHNFHLKKAPPNFNKVDNVHETRYHHHNIPQNQDYGDNMSRDESVIAFSDTLMLKSASQVPMNPQSQNPNYLYEEQEGSIDLRSEYSFYHKNAANMHKKNALNAQNLNKKGGEETKTFCEYKDISSWKDVY